MYDFHRHAEEGNQENGLVINRNEENLQYNASCNRKKQSDHLPL
jgi:hypothetical protein